MYHPSRGGVRGGRDQFTWDDVKADKYRENYIGHSVKAPIGRWQKGKDLFWYSRDKKSDDANKDKEAAMKEEIRRIKEEEEQSMREALGLAPKRAAKPQGSRLDKHEYSELVKRGSTAEDLGAGHEEAAWVHGIGFERLPRPVEELNIPSSPKAEIDAPIPIPVPVPILSVKNDEKVSDEDERERDRKRRKHDKRSDKRHSRGDLDDKRHSRGGDSDDKRKHKKDKERRRH